MFALRDQGAGATWVKSLMTVRRAGVANGQCIRVTPALFTDEADLDRLEALAVVTGTKTG